MRAELQNHEMSWDNILNYGIAHHYIRQFHHQLEREWGKEEFQKFITWLSKSHVTINEEGNFFAAFWCDWERGRKAFADHPEAERWLKNVDQEKVIEYLRYFRLPPRKRRLATKPVSK
jgi:hypothetical protein